MIAESDAELQLPEPSSFASLEDSNPMQILLIKESATCGMYGPWIGARSRMFRALCTSGYTGFTGDGGGSYGYGKGALVNGSGARIVIAYSCFRERDDDLGITRRLLGMTYWSQHEINKELSFSGFARFGDADCKDDVQPLVNQAADSLATQLGMEVRSADSVNELGTTFLLIEPTCTPTDLVSAIERWWWPALEDPSLHFNAVVLSPDGELHPRPRANPGLRPFIEAYELATVPQDNIGDERRSPSLNAIGNFGVPGKLGLVANSSQWSYPTRGHDTADGAVEHHSLVALMRKPRMVVEYWIAGRAEPFVRGTFVASDELNETLRATEPKGHDAWLTEPSGGMKSSNTSVAKTILSRIGSHVRNFRGQIRPRAVAPNELKLTEWSRLMHRLLRGSGVQKLVPVGDPRNVSINIESQRVCEFGEQIRFKGKVSFGLSDQFEGEEAIVSVQLRYAFDAEDLVREDSQLNVLAPAGFGEVDSAAYTFEGALTKGARAVFRIESEPYRNDWSGVFTVSADVVDNSQS